MTQILGRKHSLGAHADDLDRYGCRRVSEGEGGDVSWLTQYHTYLPTYLPTSRSVNLDDEDQMLNKGDRIMRRKEELERLLSRARNYRQYLAGGCQVSNDVWP